MYSKKRAWILFQSFGSFLLMLFLIACAGKAFTYKGSWVAENDRILLQDGGPHKGNRQTRDADIAYTYQQATQNLKISGGVTLGKHLTNGFSTLDFFMLDLYALDAEGMVLDSKLIQNFGHRRYLGNLGKMTFDKQLRLPAGTAAIAFGYRGRVTEGGGESGDRIDWDFWKRPGRKP